MLKQLLTSCILVVGSLIATAASAMSASCLGAAVCNGKTSSPVPVVCLGSDSDHGWVGPAAAKGPSTYNHCTANDGVSIEMPWAKNCGTLKDYCQGKYTITP